MEFRIISQDGRIDLPYDKYTLSTNFANIYANAELGNSPIIARYSTKEKCEKELENLRNAWIDNSFQSKTNTYFQFPPDDEVKANED